MGSLALACSLALAYTNSNGHLLLNIVKNSMMQNVQRFAFQRRAQACSTINPYHLRNMVFTRKKATLSEDNRTYRAPKIGRQGKPSQAHASSKNADYKEGEYDTPRDRLL